MKVRNIAILVFSMLIALLLAWYLFVKESDYLISFKVKAASGTVFQGVQDWSTALSENQQENYSVVEKRKFGFLKQEMYNETGTTEYIWEITPLNDSVTAVNVGIKELNNSIYNRLTAPFFKTKFKETQIQKITDFRNGINNHLENFRVKIDGEGTSEEVFVAYINLKSVMQEKAQTMIANDAFITGYLQQNNISIVGKPYLEIQNWNLDKETLDFNYCFPIDKNTKYIENDLVKFKTIAAVKGLQATYFGNFRTSDRAWFALLDYAKSHDIKLSHKPLEHFLANPFNGGDELKWETKIIIPFE